MAHSAHHRVPSQQANPNTDYPQAHPAFHQLHGHVQRNHYVGGDYQQNVHREIVPQPLGNVVMQGEMQHPRHINAPNYNVAPYHPPALLPYLEAPDEVQENHDGLDGYDAQFPMANPPEAPTRNMPPADGLRILAGRYLNNPGTLVNMLRIEPSPGGRFEVRLVLELADLS
ncbi:hypothetical protein EI94DRAFT_1747941 [Lactarius quietus]|nr:hypothetical protein EI94DRAFT_1747941 [Lactarius quietus]